MDEGLPVGHWSLRIYGDDRCLKGIFAANHEALDLAPRCNCFHLSADIEQVVFNVFEHVHLGNYQFSDTIRLQGEAAELNPLKASQPISH
jgi:hypothetical protein